MRRIRRLAARLVAHWVTASKAVRRQGTAWYREAGRVTRAIARQHGVTARRVAGVIAALSPRLTWAVNVRAARAVLAGKVPAGVFRASLHKAQRIAAGERPLKVLGGPKVRAFYRALLGDESSAVVDVWTARAAGLSGDALRPGEYEQVSAALALGARQMRTTTTRLQAVAWVAVRGKAS